MTAKENLLRIRKLDKLIENKMAEAQQWREIATNISANMSGERVQSSGSTDTVANAVCKAMDLENEAELFKWEKENIIKQIEKLPVIYYDVLHKIYVQDIPIKSIAAQYHKRYEWASRKHREALEAFEKLLKGKKNDQR
jgi:hypothetical protein